MTTDSGCPDDGACHHSCAPGDCFRVRYCCPLSAKGYPGDTWPTAIVAIVHAAPESRASAGEAASLGLVDE